MENHQRDREKAKFVNDLIPSVLAVKVYFRCGGAEIVS